MENLGNKDFKTLLYQDIMPKIYGIGAAIVIVGAMFKILNWPGANLMIGVGLTTEAMIFFLSSFEPPAKSYDWSKVYPELNEEFEGQPLDVRSPGMQAPMTKEYQVQMKALSETIKKLNSSYSKEAKLLDDRLGNNNTLLTFGSKTVSELEKASKEAESFRMEMEQLREKISLLNKVYDKTLNALNTK